MMSSNSSRLCSTIAREHVHRREVDLLGHRALAQREDAAVEELLRALLVEREIVEDLAHAPLRRRSSATHRDSRPSSRAAAVVVVGQLRHRAIALRLDVDHLDQQQRVVRRERAARLADDVRHRDLVLAARLGERVDDVVRVLLQRVVDARVGRRVRAVVVDAESAADVDVRDVEARVAQLDVEARQLLQPELDEADVGDLRAEMEVDQLDDVETVRRPAACRSPA